MNFEAMFIFLNFVFGIISVVAWAYVMYLCPDDKTPLWAAITFTILFIIFGCLACLGVK